MGLLLIIHYISGFEEEETNNTESPNSDDGDQVYTQDQVGNVFKSLSRYNFHVSRYISDKTKGTRKSSIIPFRSQH